MTRIRIYIFLLFIIHISIMYGTESSRSFVLSTTEDSLQHQDEVINQLVDSASTNNRTDDFTSDIDSTVINRIQNPFNVKKGEKKYILQDRYLKPGKTFSKRLFDRLEIGLQTGYNVIHPRGGVKLKSGSPMGVFAKYNFTRLSALRFGYTNTDYELENGKNKIKHHDFSLDFMYNVSSLLYGHNPNRFFNFSGVIGVGYIRSVYNGRMGNSPKGYAGLNMDIRLSPGAHLFAEPYVAVTGDKVDFSTDNPHKWDMMYGARAGIALRFNPKDNTSSGESFDGSVFLDFSHGFTFFPSDDIDLMKSVGRSYKFGVGKWIDPYLGFRLSGSLQFYNSARIKAANNSANTLLAGMAGGRVEVLVDALNLIHRDTTMTRRFGWNVSVGLEMGLLQKKVTFSSTRLRTYYTAPVISTQFLYTPPGAVSFYIEPSILFANYSIPYANRPEFRAKYTDRVYSFNIGARIARPAGSRRLHSNDVFESRTFIGLMGGLLSTIHPINISGDDKFQCSAGFAVGHEFSPYVAAKLQIDYQKAYSAKGLNFTVNGGTKYNRTALFNEDFTFLNIKALYMLNLCNLYQGYNSNRRLNFYLEGGPAYVAVINKEYGLFSGENINGTNPTPVISDTKNTDGAFALTGGGLIDYKATDRLHLQFEATGQLLMKSRIFAVSSSIKRYSLLMNTNLGVAYDLYNPHSLQNRGRQYSDEEYNGNIFFDIATGLTFFSGNNIGFFKSVGHTYRLSVGKWFDPYLGFRASGLLHYYKWATSTTPGKSYMGFVVAAPRSSDKLAGMVGARLELLLNMMNLIQHGNLSSRQFDWNIALGLEMGHMRKSGFGGFPRVKSFYGGPTIGTQLMYSPGGGVSLYLEPSILFASYSAPYIKNSNIKKQFTDKVFSLNVGVRIMQPEGQRTSSSSDEFKPRNFAGLSLGLLTDIHAINFSGDNKPQWNAGVVVGREFAPLVAAKLQIDYQKAHSCKLFRYSVDDGTTYKDPSLFNENFTFLNIKALYMLNMGNLFQGYNADRRLNFYLEGGPSYVAVLNKKYSLYSAEMAGGNNPTPIITDTSSTGGVFSLCGGGLIDFKATNKIHLQFEATGQLLMKSRIYAITGSTSRYSLFFNTNLGVTYDF